MQGPDNNKDGNGDRFRSRNLCNPCVLRSSRGPTRSRLRAKNGSGRLSRPAREPFVLRVLCVLFRCPGGERLSTKGSASRGRNLSRLHEISPRSNDGPAMRVARLAPFQNAKKRLGQVVQACPRAVCLVCPVCPVPLSRRRETVHQGKRKPRSKPVTPRREFRRLVRRVIRAKVRSDASCVTWDNQASTRRIPFNANPFLSA